MASTYLTRTPGTGQTSRTKGTLSVWLKRAKTDEEDFIFNGFESSSNQIKITFKSDAKLQINTIQSGSNHLVYETNRLFRDTSAWYHIVIAIDTTLATAGDRCRLYVNGVEETSFSTETHFSQNDLSFLTEDNRIIYIGSQQGTANYFDGSMSHYHLIDGTQYQASDFGEFDANGVWKIKTSPSVNYGTHGFFILKDGNSVTDQSGNSNNFTVGGGTLTNTEDNPSNVFATMNPLNQTRFDNDGVYSNGNTKLTMTADNADRGYGFTTFGVTQGKWYWEVKVPTTERAIVGVGDAQFVSAQTVPFFDINPSYSIGLNCTNGALNYNGTSNSSYYGTAVSANDIIQLALDMDNYLFWYGINGTWLNSATQTEIENGTATNDVTTAIGTQNVINNGEPIFPFVCDVSGTGKSNFECNFGNGYFGTTAVASAGTNASGIGIFEYDVPTGYTALSTKGLNE